MKCRNAVSPRWRNKQAKEQWDRNKKNVSFLCPASLFVGSYLLAVRKTKQISPTPKASYYNDRTNRRIVSPRYQPTYMLIQKKKKKKTVYIRRSIQFMLQQHNKPEKIMEQNKRQNKHQKPTIGGLVATQPVVTRLHQMKRTDFPPLESLSINGRAYDIGPATNPVCTDDFCETNCAQSIILSNHKYERVLVAAPPSYASSSACKKTKGENRATREKNSCSSTKKIIHPHHQTLLASRFFT